MSKKTITFGIPCYNSAAYMDRCLTSIIEGSEAATDIEVIIVDDGSHDDTLEKAHEWCRRYPDVVRVVHQENGGHGRAVMAAINHARGAYFKCVDSDDWVDKDALTEFLALLRKFVDFSLVVDLVVTSYVVEHTEDGTSRTFEYSFALPKRKVIDWGQIGHFNIAQYMMMHALTYRTEVLRTCGLDLPAHMFYVDNIYAYVPLPHCKTLYYLDVELYRYFIGREDQSVNLNLQIERVDQQIAVSREMMRSYHLYDDVPIKPLRSYMLGHLTLITNICSILSKMSPDPESRVRLDVFWHDFKRYDIRMYNRCRHGVFGTFSNFRGRVGERVSIGCYQIGQRLFKFN